jgi:predicted transcriptional regulator
MSVSGLVAAYIVENRDLNEVSVQALIGFGAYAADQTGDDFSATFDQTNDDDEFIEGAQERNRTGEFQDETWGSGDRQAHQPEPNSNLNTRHSNDEIRQSVGRDYITSFENGRKYKALKRHLTDIGMTPDEYRAKHGLPANYPMVAPSFSARRSEIAKSLGLGRGNAGGGNRRGDNGNGGGNQRQEQNRRRPGGQPGNDNGRGNRRQGNNNSN